MSDVSKLKAVQAPKEIVSILVPLLNGKAKHEKLERHHIPSEHHALLDSHASEVLEQDDCQVNFYYGCNSCCADGISSSLADTTCGQFCYQVCGSEPCF